MEGSDICGIGGIKRLEDDDGVLAEPILPSQIDLLINSLEYRGNDASGVALVSSSGEIFVHKDHEQAWKFTASEEYKRFIREHLSPDILTVMVHTRKATKGNPFTNKNNHPLSVGEGVVVHNGMISNDDQLFSARQFARGAETDSDILRAILDANGSISKDALRDMSSVSGSVAAAMAHPEDPTKLMLLRSGNPLVIADDGSHLYWASDKRAIYRAARPWIKRHGFMMQLLSPKLAFLPMPNDTGWIVGNRGLEWHDKFTSAVVKFRTQTYSDVHSPHSYPARTARFASTHVDAKPIQVDSKIIHVQAIPKDLPLLATPVKSQAVIHYVFCPTCDLCMALSIDQQKSPLARLMCRSCKTNLADAQETKRIVERVN